MINELNWLTIPGIAREYGLSRQTIWRLVRDGAVVSQRIGRQYRISRAEWVAYLERNGEKV